jgi:hypothetical protein
MVAETFPGSCYLGTNIVQCAWEASECGGLDYRSYRQAGHTKCSDNHRQYIGMCVDETLCTTNPSNCLNPDSFIAESPFCSIEYNRYADSIAGAFTLFGACNINGSSSCVWSEDSCPDGGIFEKPGETQYSNDCTCDKTKVGACRAGGVYHCAVSANACDSSEDFVEWQDTAGIIDCRVCNGFEKARRVWGVPNDYKRLPSAQKATGGKAFGNIMIGVGIGVGVTGLIACLCRFRNRGGKDLKFNAGEDGMPVA